MSEAKRDDLPCECGRETVAECLASFGENDANIRPDLRGDCAETLRKWGCEQESRGGEMTADKKLRPAGLEEAEVRALLDDALDLVGDWLRHSSQPFLYVSQKESAQQQAKLIKRSEIMIFATRGEKGLAGGAAECGGGSRDGKSTRQGAGGFGGEVMDEPEFTRKIFSRSAAHFCNVCRTSKMALTFEQAKEHRYWLAGNRMWKVFCGHKCRARWIAEHLGDSGGEEE